MMYWYLFSFLRNGRERAECPGHKHIASTLPYFYLKIEACKNPVNSGICPAVSNGRLLLTFHAIFLPLHSGHMLKRKKEKKKVQ